MSRMAPPPNHSLCVATSSDLPERAILIRLEDARVRAHGSAQLLEVGGVDLVLALEVLLLDLVAANDLVLVFCPAS